MRAEEQDMLQRRKNNLCTDLDVDTVKKKKEKDNGNEKEMRKNDGMAVHRVVMRSPSARMCVTCSANVTRTQQLSRP